MSMLPETRRHDPYRPAFGRNGSRRSMLRLGAGGAMPLFGYRWKVKLVGLLVLATSPVDSGLANELFDSVAKAAAPRYGEPSPPNVVLGPRPGRKSDALQTLAQRHLSRLDLALPQSFPWNLPPELEPPSFAPTDPDAASAEAIPPSGALASVELVFPPVEPLTPPSTAEILAGEIRVALDRFVTGATTRRPVGAGDWNAARKAIAAIYTERGYAPIWRVGGQWSASAKSAMSRLDLAGEDGLDLSETPISPVVFLRLDSPGGGPC